MDVQHAATPIFTDASGRRATVLLWMARGLCACFVLVTGAIAFTLLTQVSLPGLGGLVDPPSAARPPAAARDTADGKGAFDAARRSISKTPMSTGAATMRSERRNAPAASAETVAVRATSVSGAEPASTSGKPASSQPSQPTPAPPTTAPAPVKGSNSQGTTKSGNANPSPGTPPSTDREPNSNATSGRAVGRTDEPTTPPGRTK